MMRRFLLGVSIAAVCTFVSQGRGPSRRPYMPARILDKDLSQAASSLCRAHRPGVDAAGGHPPPADVGSQTWLQWATHMLQQQAQIEQLWAAMTWHPVHLWQQLGQMHHLQAQLLLQQAQLLLQQAQMPQPPANLLLQQLAAAAGVQPPGWLPSWALQAAGSQKQSPFLWTPTWPAALPQPYIPLPQHLPLPRAAAAAAATTAASAAASAAATDTPRILVGFFRQAYWRSLQRCFTL